MREKLKIIDFHAHILPCADHGSDGLKTSAEQIALINNAGVSAVVATPHFYPHYHTVEHFLSTVSTAAEELAASVADRPLIGLGAEVLYCEGIENMDGLSRLCVRGTDLLMLELPLSDLDKNIIYSVKHLTKKYTVVLAHIDRYMESCPDMIDALLSLGALAQINASSLFYTTVKKKLAPHIESGQIFAIGSDLHMADKKTYAYFAKAKKKLGTEYDAIMARSERLLDGAEWL